jgi:cytochrome P450
MDDSLGGLDLRAAFDAEVSGQVADPYPVYASLLADGPVYRGDMLVDHLGFESSMLTLWGGQPFTILGYREARAVLGDPLHFSSSVYEKGSVLSMGRNLIAMDPPEHRTHRALVQAAFSKRSMTRWQEEIALPLAFEALTGDFIEKGSAELMREFCVGYPISVIHHILGLPRENLAEVHQWAIGLLLYRSQLEVAQLCAERLGELVADHIAQRRNAPRDDLISALCAAVLPGGEHLSDEEIKTFLRVFLNAGSETTTSALGSLFVRLLTNQDKLVAVRGDRTLVLGAVEETLRLDPSLGVTWRLCVADAEVGGTFIPAGSPVCVAIGAANRDPREFPEPEVFDLKRHGPPHLSFGSGPHLCLGQHVARMELTTVLHVFLDRLDQLRLDPAEAPVITGITFRGPRSLRVRWD